MGRLAAMPLVAFVCILVLPTGGAAQLARARTAAVSGSRATYPDNLIVPFQRIGAIRLGMGMDQVQELLGKPSGWGGTSSEQFWNYAGLNLGVTFDRGPAPTVTSIAAMAWPRKRMPSNKIRWSDLLPVNTNFQTTAGIAIGSSAFEVSRAYSNYGHEDFDAYQMNYTSVGQTFLVTTDHVIRGIVIQPR